MKSVILSAFLFISLTTYSQVQVITPNADIDTAYKPTKVMLIPPLYNPFPSDPPRLDSAWEAIKLSADFRIVGGALALTFPPVQQVPIPAADIRQPATATRNQTIFTFRNVPSSYDDFFLYKNGLLRTPLRHYTKNGNVITTTTTNASGTEFELIMRVTER